MKDIRRPQSFTVTLAFANLGRAASAKPVRDSIAKIADTLEATHGPVVLGLVEIDEGDKTVPSDHALLAQRFTRVAGWSRKWFRSAEPILLRGLLQDRSFAARVNVGLSVAHWLPFRHLNSTGVLTGQDCPILTPIVEHYPLADHQLGGRPAGLRAAMRTAYEKQTRLERRMVNRRMKRGRHVSIHVDRNEGRYVPQFPGEVIVAHKGVDYVSVIPARGWEVEVLASHEDALYIEKFHGLVWATVRFSPVA